MSSKRVFDVIVSLLGIILLTPVIFPIAVLIWLQDFYSPIYKAPRVGKGGILFNIFKLRSMIHNADTSGVNSTSNSDNRITTIGRYIRRFKLDEIPQLFNVLFGTMSLVGPRPNVEIETLLYTPEEKKLLSVNPGITDFASIVFSDEGVILKDSKDPDLDYNQLIRPWKSRLGILYIENQSMILDFKLLLLTVYALFSKRRCLLHIQKILISLKANRKLIDVCTRANTLSPFPPPGTSEIASSNDYSK